MGRAEIVDAIRAGSFYHPAIKTILARSREAGGQYQTEYQKIRRYFRGRERTAHAPVEHHR